MKKNTLFIVLIAILFSSCKYTDDLFGDILGSEKENKKLTIIPFSNDNIRYGLVDLNGNIIVDNEWESPSSIATDGVVRVRNKDGYFEFYSATTNPKKIGNEYRDATLFSEGLAAVVNEQGFIHYIDIQGNIKFELPDDGKGSSIQKAGAFSEGLARFQNSENLWGFINVNGEVVIKPRYDFVRNFKEGLAYVERYNMSTNERSIGFIDKNDEELIPLSERYTVYSDFSSGLAACSDKTSLDQWGYINKSGDRVIEINKIKAKVMPFQDDYAAFFDGSYWGLIDKSGEIVVNPNFDNMFSFYRNELGPYINSSNEIGFINSSRKEVIKCQYESVLPFYSNTTVVKDKYYIFIDGEGNSVSKTYLKYVPLKDIINQYENIPNNMIRNLFINTKNIVDVVIQSVSSESVNNLSFNSTVFDVINYYKIPKSKLPNNSRQKYVQTKIDLTGKIDPFIVKLEFNEPINSESSNSRSLEVNERARLKLIEFNILTKSLENEQIENIVALLKGKFEKAKYTLDVEMSSSSWKPNAAIYKLDRSVIELYYDATEITIKFDYSQFY